MMNETKETKKCNRMCCSISRHNSCYESVITSENHIDVSEIPDVLELPDMSSDEDVVRELAKCKEVIKILTHIEAVSRKLMMNYRFTGDCENCRMHIRTMDIVSQLHRVECVKRKIFECITKEHIDLSKGPGLLIIPDVSSDEDIARELANSKKMMKILIGFETSIRRRMNCSLAGDNERCRMNNRIVDIITQLYRWENTKIAIFEDFI